VELLAVDSVHQLEFVQDLTVEAEASAAVLPVIFTMML